MADWQAWSARCRYDGPHKDTVLRSLITLKALTYAPTGGIVAAPPPPRCRRRSAACATGTTATAGCATPRSPWARCWRPGYHEEAEAWRDWLVRAVAGDPARLQIMYGLAGERRLPESALPWLRGFAGSAPVRIGNDAVRQLQLDVYGQVMDSLSLARTAGMTVKPLMWQLQCALLEWLRSAWRQPDEGVWEVRGGRRHFVHSKVMVWVAADRAVRTLERYPELGGDLHGWRAMREEVHREVCERGYDPERNTFTQYYGSRELDAATLLIPRVGFLPPDDPRVRGTVEAVRAELCQEGFLHRYSADRTAVDGLPGGEGTFLVCSFWLADALHMTGRRKEARELFERLVGLTNDVGLLAEEYDPVGGRQLGNFPQAFSHIGLVSTALALFGDDGAG
ncbi:hypothetical protein GCM10020295_65030 [Streptomyces cinereospinus]